MNTKPSSRSIVGIQLYVKIWSTLPNTPDTPRYGVYRLALPRMGMNKDALAGAVLNFVRDYIGLTQPHLAVFQIFDRNGHEIPNPQWNQDHGDIGPHVCIEHIVHTEAPLLVDATRTGMDAISQMYQNSL